MRPEGAEELVTQGHLAGEGYGENQNPIFLPSEILLPDNHGAPGAGEGRWRQREKGKPLLRIASPRKSTFRTL